MKKILLFLSLKYSFNANCEEITINYLTIKMLQDVYLLLLNLITENKGAEGAMEIKRKCRDHAEKNIAKLGYLKVEHE